MPVYLVERRMRTRAMRAAAVSLVAAAWLGLSLAETSAQRSGDGVTIDPDDIGGVVSSAKGPEAGVWVIAETMELPSPFRKIVVTDDRGRYVIPDLPKADRKSVV